MLAVSAPALAINTPSRLDFNPLHLLSIFDAPEQVCVVQRPANAAIAQYVRSMASKLTPGFRLLLNSHQSLAAQIEQHVHLPAAAGKQALLNDMAQLAQVFAELLDCPKIGLRLEVAAQAMCPKFHIDRTGIRLLCTYQGPGTEWLTEADTNRLALTAKHHTLEAFHAQLMKSPQAIQQAPAFAIVLLKGSAWQGNQHAGAVHRSPQIETGSPRVLLALDALW